MCVVRYSLSPDSMPTYYTTTQIANECRVSIWTVTRHLRATMPCAHYFKQWWRLDKEEFEMVCAVLISAKLACPDQPLHAINSPQKFLIFGVLQILF
jgi:hypothetical protein